MRAVARMVWQHPRLALFSRALGVFADATITSDAFIWTVEFLRQLLRVMELDKLVTRTTSLIFFQAYSQRELRSTWLATSLRAQHHQPHAHVHVTCTCTCRVHVVSCTPSLKPMALRLSVAKACRIYVPKAYLLMAAQSTHSDSAAVHGEVSRFLTADCEAFRDEAACAADASKGPLTKRAAVFGAGTDAAELVDLDACLDALTTLYHQAFERERLQCEATFAKYDGACPAFTTLLLRFRHALATLLLRALIFSVRPKCLVARSERIPL